jgi:hypothetical protein
MSQIHSVFRKVMGENFKLIINCMGTMTSLGMKFNLNQIIYLI